MITKLSVFISSTSDLTEERRTIAAELPMSFDAYLYERDRARGSSPEARLEEVLDNVEVFVGVLGGRYGSVYPDCEGNRSIVEWEFEQAESRARSQGVEVMPFLKELPETEIDEDQRRFRERIGGLRMGKWCKFYRTPEEVADLVKDSLLEWLVDYRIRAREAILRPEALRSRQRLRLATLGLSILPVLAAVGLVLAGAATPYWTGCLVLSILTLIGGLLYEGLQWSVRDD